MNKRRITCFSLSILTCASATLGTIPFSNMSFGCAPALAASSERGSATGLDAKSLALVNKGDWQGLVNRLQPMVASLTSASVLHGWLAFGEMFLDKAEDLKSLSQKVASLPSTPQTANVAKNVEVFNLICQKKYDDASKLALSIAGPDSKDVLTNLALAACYAKNSDADKAIEYCGKVVALAPDFAWGYRTIGFIDERTKHDPVGAEEAYLKALAVAPDSKEVRDLLSDLRLTHNDFDGAIDIANGAIKVAPHDPNNYYRLSQIYTQQWRLREADAQLDKAIRLAPDNARYHRARASILRHQGKLGEAIAEQKRAVDLSNDKPFELTELAALNELAGNDSEAADDLKEAIKLSPSSQSAHTAAQQKLVQLLIKGKRWNDLVAEFQEAVQVNPKDTNLRLGLADALIKAGKVDEAMTQLKEAANNDATDPRPHSIMGMLLIQKKDFPAAARAYTRALNINPGSVDNLVALGYSYALDDDYMQAETAFVTALALQQLTNAQGNRAIVMRSFATLLLSEGRYSEAALNYEQVLHDSQNAPVAKLDAFMLAQSVALKERTAAKVKNLMDAYNALPDSDKAAQRVSLADTLLRLGKIDEAVTELNKADDAQRQDSQWLTLQARAMRLKKDLNAADDFAGRAVAAKEDSKDNQVDALVEQAQVKLAKGELDAADTAIRKATDTNGKSFEAYEVLGQIYLKRHDAAHALEAAKHATDINPYYSPAYILMGDAQVMENHADQALASYKKAVELYPSFVDAHRGLRDAYKKLANKDEVQKEDALISQIEKQS